MKRVVVGVIAAVCLFVLLPHWTSKIKNHPPQRQLNPHQQFQDKRSQTMLEDQEYALLAMKYGVPVEITKSILTDYDLALWGVNLLEPGKEELVFPEATNTSEVIMAISNKYSISSVMVASLLVDRELIQQQYDRSEPDEPAEPPEPPDDY